MDKEKTQNKKTKRTVVAVDSDTVVSKVLDISKTDTVPDTNQGIAYQNKDIMSKLLAELFPKTSFEVYQIQTPQVARLLPTNLPKLQLNELRLDNLFQFVDGSYAIVDYESKYRTEDKIKYTGYLIRILQRYLHEPDLRIRLIVIYTADIKRRNVNDVLDVGALRVTVEPAFLSELDSEKILEHITNKIRNGQSLDDGEKMQFIILPLSFQGQEKKIEVIGLLFELVKMITDVKDQAFLIAGLIAFADKVIDENVANMMKGWTDMTKVARLFEEEKQKALKQQAEEKQGEIDALKEELQNSINAERTMVKMMLDNGIPEEQIYRCAPNVAHEVICECKAKYGNSQ